MSNRSETLNRIKNASSGTNKAGIASASVGSVGGGVAGYFLLDQVLGPVGGAAAGAAAGLLAGLLGLKGAKMLKGKAEQKAVEKQAREVLEKPPTAEEKLSLEKAQSFDSQFQETVDLLAELEKQLKSL